MTANNKIKQACADCVVGDCAHKTLDSCTPRCPADPSAALGDDLLHSLAPLSCPVCGSLIDQGIRHGALLARAHARIEALHPACLKCGDLFTTCEGTTGAEWEARFTDPEQVEDPFCHQLAFAP
jgi:hypothetical protein